MIFQQCRFQVDSISKFKLLVFQVSRHYVLIFWPSRSLDHRPTDLPTCLVSLCRDRYNLVAEQATPIRSWDKTAWNPWRSPGDWSASVTDNDYTTIIEGCLTSGYRILDDFSISLMMFGTFFNSTSRQNTSQLKR